MADVALMFSNVWYAADKKNWPLANYYLNETEGRLRWMVRINPMPKGPTGAVDIQARVTFRGRSGQWRHIFRSGSGQGRGPGHQR